jgi:hypothetical protein
MPEVSILGRSRPCYQVAHPVGERTKPSNNAMQELTRVERIGRSQLIPSLGRLPEAER